MSAVHAGAPKVVRRASAPQPRSFDRRDRVGSYETLEREADRGAMQALQRASAGGIPAANPAASRSIPTTTPADAPPLVERALVHPGRALKSQDRAFFERGFGHDFGDVRIHDDAPARHSARLLGAQAYTIGSHVVFDSMQPGTLSGAARTLFAHELTHVLQQRSGMAWGVQRKPSPRLYRHPDRTNYRFDTGRVTAKDLEDPEFLSFLHSLSRAGLRSYLTRVNDPDVREYIEGLLRPAAVADLEENWMIVKVADVNDAAKTSYWEQRLMRQFTLTYRTSRLDNAEERDAVLAAAWQVKPTGPVTQPLTHLVTIPASETRKKSLLYTLEFRPSANPAKLDGLYVDFKSESSASVVQYAAEPAASFKPAALSFDTEIGFERGADSYFQARPQEMRQLAWWLSQRRGKFEQVLVTRSAAAKGGAVRETTVFVKGVRDAKGNFSQLQVEKLANRRPTAASLPEDYRKRDYADLLISEAQSKPSKKGDMLGEVDLTGVPSDEALSVKFMIVQYFNVTGTRDAEADAIVPIAGTKRRVFYRLRFRRGNDVDVARVGEEGASAKLDPDRLDVARADGFDDNSQDAARFKSWLGTRYPGIKPTGSTVGDLQTSANEAMQREADTAPWFDANYKLVVLNGPQTATRLRATHKQAVKSTAGTQDFAQGELKLVELSLQTISLPLLKQLRATRLGRKAQALKADGTPDLIQSPDGTTSPYAGHTFHTGTQRTVVFYDGMVRAGTQYMFRGSLDRVSRQETENPVHEFGHVIEQTASARRAFNKFVKDEGIAPFTDYARSSPEREFFSEAFSMYHTSPAWLRENHPRVFQWLDILSKTGKVPKKL